MTKCDRIGYEMECALAEQINADVRLTSEQLFYVVSLAMEACIAAPEKVRPAVLYETYSFLEALVRWQKIRFQPLMQKALDDRYARFVDKVYPFAKASPKNRVVEAAANQETHSAI